jgi:DtxR family Mn-dependent transcriptional regulator
MKPLKKERGFYTVRGYQMLNAENKTLTSSMEDYLEMICRTCREEGYVRVNQLAEMLNVRPSSTTKVIQKLNALGLVDYQKYGIIQPTEEGKAIGDFLLKRHEIIEEFLGILGIEETRLKDTEMIEHDVSLNTLIRSISGGCLGSVSSSSRSPTSSSRRSTIVIIPFMPPYSSSTIAKWFRLCFMLRNSTSVRTVSGTKYAGFTACLSMFSRVFSLIRK